MKKAIVLLLTVCMLAMLAVGCGTDDSKDSEAKATATPTAAAAETEDAETVTEAATETGDAAVTTAENADAETVTEAAGKSITIKVKNAAGDEAVYDVVTNAEFLRGAMDDAADLGFTYAGTDSDYGIMIETINGEDAIYSVDGSYWSIYVNGEYGMYGADSQPVADGDVFEFIYTK